MKLFRINKIEKLGNQYGTQAILDTPVKIKSVINQCIAKKRFALDVETTGLNPRTDQVLGIALCCEKGKPYYLNLNPNQGTAAYLDTIQPLFEPLLTNSDLGMIGHNVKFDIAFLINQLGMTPKCQISDSMIVEQIISGGSPPAKLDFIVKKYLNHEMVSFHEIADPNHGLVNVDLGTIAWYAMEDVDYTFQVWEYLLRTLSPDEIKVLKLEQKVLPVVVSMENVGVGVDIEHMQQAYEHYVDQAKQDEVIIRKRFKEVGKEKVNLDSPSQLGNALVACNIPLTEKTEKKNQVKVTDEVLHDLAKDHELVAQVVSYRKHTKHASTIQTQFISHTQQGRIHPSYIQVGAGTGRFACREPNLQNISREPLIRNGFIAREGYMLIAADYSQIELRVLAHLSQDRKMIESFNQNLDLHQQTATALGIERNHAKGINFGLVYGMGKKALARTLEISGSMAEQYVIEYYHLYSGVAQYRRSCIEQAKKQGWVSTLLGRKRILGDGNLDYISTRALNTIVQGTAADILKQALVQVYKNLEQMDATMVLNVHDEIVVECVNHQVDEVIPLIQEGMETAENLTVPLVVDITLGERWGSLQPYPLTELDPSPIPSPPAWDYTHPYAQGAIPYEQEYEDELRTGHVKTPNERVPGGYR